MCEKERGSKTTKRPNSKILTDFYEYENGEDEAKKAYLEKHKGQEELIQECEKCCKMYKEMDKKSMNCIKNRRGSSQKHGLYCGWGAKRKILVVSGWNMWSKIQILQ